MCTYLSVHMDRTAQQNSCCMRACMQARHVALNAREAQLAQREQAALDRERSVQSTFNCAIAAQQEAMASWRSIVNERAELERHRAQVH